MAELVLYGHPDSGHACKIALALALAGRPHRTVWVDIWAAPETRPAAFLADSPLAEVPLLVIDGVPHTQSGAILLEIADRFGCLGAEDPDGARRGREILFWEANRIGLCLPWLRLARCFDAGAVPEGALTWLRERFVVDCQRFEVLLGDRSFFHGDAPGFADCGVWGYAQWVSDAGVEATPIMRDWLDRMSSLEAMRTPDEFFPR